jgi:hypothetical protein
MVRIRRHADEKDEGRKKLAHDVPLLIRGVWLPQRVSLTAPADRENAAFSDPTPPTS